jgi:hypothetical protein
MTKNITLKIKEFFDTLPEGRVDQFCVSRQLMDSDFALQVCFELNLACKFSSPRDVFIFSNLDFHEPDIKDYEAIIAHYGIDGVLKRWVSKPSQTDLDLMDYRSAILSDLK